MSHVSRWRVSLPACTQVGVWGNRNVWDPWAYAEQRHPDVRVVVMKLPARVQGCVDAEQRTIWLDEDLTPVQARCVLAYELGQLEHGVPSDDPCVQRARQRAAEEWAALMLIPSEVFVSAWGNCLDLSAMAARCNVDLPTFRARIRAASDADQDAAMQAIADTRISSA